MARIGPVVMEVVNDAYIQPCRINAIIWEGAMSVGDRVVLRHRGTHELLWQARTNDTNTYLGGNLGVTGIHAPNGVYAAVLSAGTVMIYLREE